MISIPYFMLQKWYHLLEAIVVKNPDFWLSFSQSFLTTLVYLVMNLFYMVLYLGKWPCIEKFKGSDQSWPWETDPNWRSTFTRMILLTLFNSTVVTFVPAYIICKTLGDNLLIKSEEMPSVGLFMIQFSWCF